MPTLPHLPALRRGKPYASLEQTPVKDFRTGEAMVHLSQVNAGIIRKDLARISEARSALKQLSCDRLLEICEKYDVPPIVSYGSCTDVGKILDTVAALCWTIGCDSSQLPVAAAVPEYMEQKAVADIFTALSYGLLTYVSPEPMISGSAKVVKYLTEDLVNVTGGRLFFEPDPVKAADEIEAHIMKNRKLINFD